MSSKSNVMALAYLVVAIMLVGVYASGLLAPVATAIGLPAERADVLAAMAIGATALVTAFAGAAPVVVMSIATVAAFVPLTLNQHPLVRYLTFAAVLFTIGAYGMVVSRNAVRVLICIELMLNAVNINLVAFARYIDPIFVRGQLFAIFILTVAAAEAAVGLAIVLAVYRNTATVDMEKFDLLKW